MVNYSRSEVAEFKMYSMKESKKSKRTAGRKKIENPCIYRYTLKLNRENNELFQRLFSETGLRAKSQFLYACVFRKEIPVRIINQNQRELVTEIYNHNRQIRMLGVNYNQVVREIHTHFSAQDAGFYLKKLVEISTEIAILSQKILDIIQKYDSENNRG